MSDGGSVLLFSLSFPFSPFSWSQCFPCFPCLRFCAPILLFLTPWFTLPQCWRLCGWHGGVRGEGSGSTVFCNKCWRLLGGMGCSSVGWNTCLGGIMGCTIRLRQKTHMWVETWKDSVIYHPTCLPFSQWERGVFTWLVSNEYSMFYSLIPRPHLGRGHGTRLLASSWEQGYKAMCSCFASWVCCIFPFPPNYLVLSPDPTLSRGQKGLAGRSTRAGHETTHYPPCTNNTYTLQLR